MGNIIQYIIYDPQLNLVKKKVNCESSYWSYIIYMKHLFYNKPMNQLSQVHNNGNKILRQYNRQKFVKLFWNFHLINKHNIQFSEQVNI